MPNNKNDKDFSVWRETLEIKNNFVSFQQVCILQKMNSNEQKMKWTICFLSLALQLFVKLMMTIPAQKVLEDGAANWSG